VAFGRTGRSVSRVGLGGEGILRTFGEGEAAQRVIEEAAFQGITYFDSARAYAGSEGYYGSFWAGWKKMRNSFFQASKSAFRSRKGALADLETTLSNTGLEYLDLWQIHDLRTVQELRDVEAPGGALEAFLEARSSGRVRHIGVTGHHDPEVLTQAINRWDVDAVLLPVNPVEGVLGGFLDSTMGAAEDKGLAAIGMKVLGGGHFINRPAGVTPEKLIRYALSQVSQITVGCSSAEEVRFLAQMGRQFQPLDADEQHSLLEVFMPFARKLAFYRGDL